MLKELNRETDHKYDEIIQHEILIIEMSTLERCGDAKKVFQEKYKAAFDSLPKKRRTKLWIKAYLPSIYNIYKRGRK